MWASGRPSSASRPCGLFHGNYPATVTGGTWSATLDTSALAEGEYCLEVNATDAVGHVGWGDFGYVTVDHGAPGDVTLDSPSDGSMRTSKNVTLTWFAPSGPTEPLTYQYELGTSSTLLPTGRSTVRRRAPASRSSRHS